MKHFACETDLNNEKFPNKEMSNFTSVFICTSNFLNQSHLPSKKNRTSHNNKSQYITLYLNILYTGVTDTEVSSSTFNQ